MNIEEHPVLRDAASAMQTAIVYHDDPIAAVVAQRVIACEAKYLDERSMRRAYGQDWDALLGLLRLADTISPDEEAVLSDRLTLRHRRLLHIGWKWLIDLDRGPLVNDVFEDLHTITCGFPERTVCALRVALVANLLHRVRAEDTPITVHDEVEMTMPIRAVLISRGVNL